MHTKPYGLSGRTVSALGLGAGQIGDPSLDEARVMRLLNTSLDVGITLIDTARSYGLSEDRIGRHLAHRRTEFILSTKVGHGIPGTRDWTGVAIGAGIDEALRKLNSDVIDIVHLHSCELNVLQTGEVVEALLRARDQGKVRTVAYSGENEALAFAVASGSFGGIECSVNLFDQASLDSILPRAAERGMGVIAKRPLGNAPWRFDNRPVGDYCEVYWERMQRLAYDASGLPWSELALRFSAFRPGVSSAIVGTSSIEHLQHAVAVVEKGPLPDDVIAAIRQRFQAVGAGWKGEV